MAALSGARRVVVKIGSALLVDRERCLRAVWLRALAEDVAGCAPGARMSSLSPRAPSRSGARRSACPTDLTLEQSQAAAAVGQIRLAGAYEAALGAHGLRAAQVLVTLEDSADRRRYLNSRATLEQLLRSGRSPSSTRTTPSPPTRSAMATMTGWRRRWR